MTRRLPPVARFRLHNSRSSYLPNPTLTTTGQLHCKNADNDDIHLQLQQQLHNSMHWDYLLVITTWLGWNSARYGLPSFRLPTNHYKQSLQKDLLPILPMSISLCTSLHSDSTGHDKSNENNDINIYKINSDWIGLYRKQKLTLKALVRQ